VRRLVVAAAVGVAVAGCTGENAFLRGDPEELPEPAPSLPPGARLGPEVQAARRLTSRVPAAQATTR